jgi:hypothetical protein
MKRPGRSAHYTAGVTYMSSPTVSPANPPALSHGSAIEYKAFARRFFSSAEGAVLFLAATCYYDSQGWVISFQPIASGFELVEQPPTHAVPQLVTYCSASWNSGQQELTVPTHVTITDSFGEHRVHVKDW